MIEPKVSYEEYIPTDKFTIQDMYFWGIQLLRQDYARIMRAWYNNQGIDQRALIDFFADADGFFWFANVNIMDKNFLTDVEKNVLKVIFIDGKYNIKSVQQAREIFQMIMRFSANSKLTDLSESRPMGDFAYARSKLGLDFKQGRHDMA